MKKLKSGAAALLLLAGLIASNVAHAEWMYCTPVVMDGRVIDDWRHLPCGEESDTYGIRLDFIFDIWGYAHVMAHTNADNLQYQVEVTARCDPPTEECFKNPRVAYGPLVREGLSSATIAGGVWLVTGMFWVP